LRSSAADFVADFGYVRVWFQFGDFEGEFAGEGVAIGVQAGGGKRQERVAGLYVFTSENIFAFRRFRR